MIGNAQKKRYGRLGSFRQDSRRTFDAVSRNVKSHTVVRESDYITKHYLVVEKITYIVL